MSPAIGPTSSSTSTCDHGDVTFGIDPDPVYLRRCDEDVVFYAPIEAIAGPIGMCAYHLARYLEDVDDRLEAELVERGAREHVDGGFVTIDDAPPLFVTEDDEGVSRVWSRVAIDQRGRAHYQRPEDEEALRLDGAFEQDFAEFGDGGFPGYMESIRTKIGFAAFDEDLSIPTGAADPEDSFRSDDRDQEVVTDGGQEEDPEREALEALVESSAGAASKLVTDVDLDDLPIEILEETHDVLTAIRNLRESAQAARDVDEAELLTDGGRDELAIEHRHRDADSEEWKRRLFEPRGFDEEPVTDGGHDRTIVDAGDRVGIGLERGDAKASIVLPKDASPRAVVRVLDRLEKVARNELAYRQRSGDVDEDPEDTFREELEGDQDDDRDDGDETKYGHQGVGTEVLTDGGRDRPAFIGPQTEWVECYLCGRIIGDFSRVEGLDISPDDEYYPKMVPVCRDHNHLDPELEADGGREPVTVDHLLAVCELVEEGDEVDLETGSYDYAAPLEVAEVTVVRWRGGGWRTARLVLEGVRGGEHKIVGVEGDDEIRDFVGEYPLLVYQLDPVDVELPDEPDDDPGSPLAPEDSPHKYTTNGALDDLERSEEDEEEGLDPLEDGEGRPWSELGVTPPRGLTRADLEAAVQKTDRLYGVCRELGLGPTDRGMIRVLLTNEGLYRELDMPEARRRSGDAESELATDGGRLYDRPECGTVEDVVQEESEKGDFNVTRCAECGSRVFLTDGGRPLRANVNGELLSREVCPICWERGVFPVWEPVRGFLRCLECGADQESESWPDDYAYHEWLRRSENRQQLRVAATDGGHDFADPAGASAAAGRADDVDELGTNVPGGRTSASEESFRNPDVATSEDSFRNEQRDLGPAHRLGQIAKQARILRDELDLVEGDAPELAAITAAATRIAERHGVELDHDRIAPGGGDPA